MSRIALVSGGDATYYPLISEWIHSVRRYPQSYDMDICILDSGMTEAQKEKLAPRVSKIVTPDWPCPLPASKIRGKEFARSCVCRPFLPQLFPGYDMYFWMDSDTWIQSWEAMDLFLLGADRGRIAVTSQSDRAYTKGMRLDWLGPMPIKARGFYYSNAKRAFSHKVAQKLFPYHVLLAGAFALRGDAPHWARWQELIISALQKGPLFTAEQMTLGILVHLERYPVEILPAWCHWLCEFKPLWDEERRMFVEPFLPHKDIGILHMAGFDAMRRDRRERTDFQTLDGEERVSLTYRYPYYDGETDQEIEEDDAPGMAA